MQWRRFSIVSYLNGDHSESSPADTRETDKLSDFPEPEVNGFPVRCFFPASNVCFQTSINPYSKDDDLLSTIDRALRACSMQSVLEYYSSSVARTCSLDFRSPECQ